TPGPLPVLLLLLAGIPAARPTPPTCYSRMRALSQEITRDFQLLQVSEPSEPCVRYLPRLYLDIHDLVFLLDDCNALEYPIPVTTVLPDRQR
ncbi:CYTL1 isoform 3, partial [Pongo abelii]